jgi:V-type H+-transporting ATPase subunit a
MIILKWSINWNGKDAPDILHTMSEFFLSPFTANNPPLYDGQIPVQLTLLALAGISIPWLLCCAPIYEVVHHKLTHRKHAKKLQQVHEEHKEERDDKDLHSETPDLHSEGLHNETLHRELYEDKQLLEDESKHVEHVEEEEKFSVQDIFVHQLIHTIEFALGTVSNTASYLRLWALSLAHAQLSEVFFQLTIKLVLTWSWGIDWLDIVWNTGVPLIIAYLVWIGLTSAVLLGMESLGAFLHSLRLHWVEFQSKFYLGDGRLFEPFSYDNIFSKI